MASEKGMVVYIHKDTGDYCPVLNTFDTTPEAILQVMIQSILDTDEFTDFPDGSRFHEFAIMFKRNAEVRARVYEKIAALSARSDRTKSKKLFALVLAVLSDAQEHMDERQFKILISEFFIGFGLAFEKAVAQLDGFDKSGFTRLKAEMAFQKKYVHNMRTADTFDISAWARFTAAGL
jgi:hypothetical protein